ncbi:MAG TPA: glutathione peroxidase, partial [Variovorax sp.]|nr:glutathione peroxidase [Variovorax sp.]
MKTYKQLFLLGFMAVICGAAAAAAPALLDLDYRPLTGKAPVNLNKVYAGKVLLVVNTASK